MFSEFPEVLTYLVPGTIPVQYRSATVRVGEDQYSTSNYLQFQKLVLVAFLLPIFRNVDGSWRVTSKLRGSTLIQVARRRSKVFQRFSASLVRVGDVQGVSRRHAVRGKKIHHMVFFWGV